MEIDRIFHICIETVRTVIYSYNYIKYKKITLYDIYRNADIMQNLVSNIIL